MKRYLVMGDKELAFEAQKSADASEHVSSERRILDQTWSS